MRIFQVTIDSSCFAANPAIQKFPDEIKLLTEWNNKGWIDLIKSDVLEKETDDIQNLIGKKNLKELTKSLATDYGINLYGHSHSNWGFQDGESRFNEIYKMIFPGIAMQDGVKTKNRVRDALHLDTHSINNRDYFVNNDVHYLSKREIIKNKFNIEIVDPKECVEIISNQWENNPGNSPAINQNESKIIAGTCKFDNFILREEKEIIFSIINMNGFFVFGGYIYNSEGNKMAEFGDKVIVSGEGFNIHAYSDPARESKIILSKNDINEGRTFSSVILSHNKERILEAKILADGKIWVFGELFNSLGQRAAFFDKKCMILGPAVIGI